MNWEPSLAILLFWKFVLIFPLYDFILASRFFSMHAGSLSNSFLILFLTFSQISLYFSNNSSFVIKKAYV